MLVRSALGKTFLVGFGSVNFLSVLGLLVSRISGPSVKRLIASGGVGYFSLGRLSVRFASVSFGGSFSLWSSWSLRFVSWMRFS